MALGGVLDTPALGKLKSKGEKGSSGMQSGSPSMSHSESYFICGEWDLGMAKGPPSVRCLKRQWEEELVCVLKGSRDDQEDSSSGLMMASEAQG